MVITYMLTKININNDCFVIPLVTIVIVYNKYNEIMYQIKTMLCLLKVYSNAITLTMHFLNILSSLTLFY